MLPPEYSNILDRIASIVKRYSREAELTGENFNIFRILKMEAMESRTHSAFLAELLNPRGSHGMKDIFLKLFIASFSYNKTLGKLDTVTASATTEEFIDWLDETKSFGGRVDVCIKDRSGHTVFIENKIYAKDQINQLRRYHNERPLALFYLTLDGRSPDDDTLEEGGDYKCISYGWDIIKWLESCRKEAVTHSLLRESITQYINLLKHLTNQTVNEMKKEDIVSCIITSPESLVATFDLADNISAAKRRLAGEVEKQLKPLETRLNAEILVSEDLSERYACVTFQPTQWRDTKILFEFRKPGFNDLCYGLVVDRNHTDTGRVRQLDVMVKSKLRGIKSSWAYCMGMDAPYRDWGTSREPWIQILNNTISDIFEKKAKMLIEAVKDLEGL